MTECVMFDTLSEADLSRANEIVGYAQNLDNEADTYCNNAAERFLFREIQYIMEFYKRGLIDKGKAKGLKEYAIYADYADILRAMRFENEVYDSLCRAKHFYGEKESKPFWAAMSEIFGKMKGFEHD